MGRTGPGTEALGPAEHTLVRVPPVKVVLHVAPPVGQGARAYRNVKELNLMY